MRLRGVDRAGSKSQEGVKKAQKAKITKRLSSETEKVGTGLAVQSQKLQKAASGNRVVQAAAQHYTVKKLVAAWTATITLIAMLIAIQAFGLVSFGSTPDQQSRAEYVEAVVGGFSNLNPIFATSQADSTVGSLLFRPLLKYEADSQLVGDIAKSWKLNASGEVYTVVLNEDQYWNDGEVIDADDVVFTIEAIQNINAKSPLKTSWNGVKVQAKDSLTVTFALPNSFRYFEHSLALPILPEHAFSDTSFDNLRTASFNIAPTVSSGAYQFSSLLDQGDDGGEVLLELREDVADKELAEIGQITVKSYDSIDSVKKALTDGDVAGFLDVGSEIDSSFDAISPISFNTFSQQTLFFRKESDLLGTLAARRALTQALDRTLAASVIGKKPLKGPLLDEQVDFKLTDDFARTNISAAEELIEGLKYTKSGEGIYLDNDGEAFSFTLAASNREESALVAEEVARQWRAIGLSVEVELVPDELLFSQYIGPHDYDVLLHTVEVGPDPDVFVYWHSSQASIPGLNLSEVQDDELDSALEAARTRTDGDIVDEKLRAFLDRWYKLYPAIPLTQGSVQYYLQDYVDIGETPMSLANFEDRLNSVQRWQLQ